MDTKSASAGVLLRVAGLVVTTSRRRTSHVSAPLILVVAGFYAPLALAPICTERWPGCSVQCIQSNPAYEDWAGCHGCPGYCFAAGPGAADDVVRALEGGPVRVCAVGDTVVVTDPDETKRPPGLEFDIDLARRFAEVNPAVATALLSFHVDYRAPVINLLRGAVANPGMPTRASFELGVARVGDRAKFLESLTPLEPGLYLQVRWDAHEVDSDTLEVTFFTEIIDEESNVKRRTHPNGVMLVSKSTRAVLSLTQQ